MNAYEIEHPYLAFLLMLPLIAALASGTFLMFYTIVRLLLKKGQKK